MKHIFVMVGPGPRPWACPRCSQASLVHQESCEGGQFVETKEGDMFLKRRGEFILMLIVNNLCGLVPFLIFVTEPDALWAKKVLYSVIGVLFLSIGNWFVADSWGPQSRNAQRERELNQEAPVERGDGHHDS